LRYDDDEVQVGIVLDDEVDEQCLNDVHTSVHPLVFKFEVDEME
jgi:hypothetical protein